MQRDGRATTARLAGTLNGDLEARRFEMPDLALNAKVSDPKLAKGTFEGALSGSARADMTKETASIDLTGKLDDSSIHAKAGLTDFSPLAVNFGLKADRLDVDKLLGKKTEGKPAAKPATAKDEKIDLSALKGVNAAGSVEVGRLTAINLTAEQVRMNLKIANGRLDVSPIAAQLYQGTLKGALSAHAAENAEFSMKQTLSGVAVGPLLRDAAQIDMLEGRGTVSADLSSRGATIDALRKALDGTASVNLRDGAIKGVDIAGAIRAARTNLDQLRGRPVQESSNMAQKTDFTELTATFRIRDGVAHNNDLSLKSPLLRLGGAGDIDIGNERLNYVLKATVVGTSKGQGGREAAALKGVTVPVKLTGAFDAPQWSIDFAGLATGLATQTLKGEVDRALGRVIGGEQPGAGKKEGGKPSSVEERLRGIFGR
jgi:AsmA protein